MKRREFVISGLMLPICGHSAGLFSPATLRKFYDSAITLASVLLTSDNHTAFTAHLNSAASSNLVVPPQRNAPSFHEQYGASHFVYTDWNKPTMCTRTFAIKKGPIVHVEPRFETSFNDLNGMEMRTICSNEVTNRFNCVPWTLEAREEPKPALHNDMLAKAMSNRNLDPKDYRWHYTRKFVVNHPEPGYAMALAHVTDPEKSLLIFA